MLLDHRVIALVVFLGSFLPALLSKYRESMVKSKLGAVEAQIRNLKRQAVPLNTPATFAKYAKIQREIQKLEKDSEKLKEKATPKKLELTLQRFPFMLKVLFLVAMSISLGYGSPLVQLPDSIVGPLSRFVSTRKGLAGNITGSMWIFACERSAGIAAHTLVDLIGAIAGLLTFRRAEAA